MRKSVPLLVAGFLSAWLSGCGGRPGRDDRPAAERMLGIRRGDSGFEELTLEGLEAELAQPRDGLRLAAELDREEYRPDEPLILSVRLENLTGGRGPVAPRDVPVYFEPFARMPEGGRGEWLFKFLVERDDGQVMYRSPIFPVPEKDREGYYHYVLLPEQASIGRKFQLRAPRDNNWLEPGESYSLLVSYTVSDDYPYVILNRQFTAEQVELLGIKLAYVRVWTGRLYSNRVRFTVRKKRKRFLFF